ncbi:MAG: UDP-N-acetylmuramoyl-tripeptide--D-alanyl-D-alanine ligase [Prolixibacteraceae bacterium]|nr:UDP-N-acetylmuramoyl-tripeptide--D-alanyl-D-alanine ligase [Prolixibacteraceae bacterium]
MTTTNQIYQFFKKSFQITTDSREVAENSIFFALKGESFNGNKFAEIALKKGASLAVIDEKEFYIPEKTILVNNVLQTLQDLAAMHRRKLGIPVLAVTGTNGKTTTKELIANVMSAKFKVVFTPGNLNNHIGVPLTLLKMNSETEFGVVEMGANHPGEIARLCKIATPDYGIITNIGKAHLEGFGSFEGVVEAKNELYEFIKKRNGTVFFNKDSVLLENLVKGISKRVSYGTTPADFTGELVNAAPFVDVKAMFAKGILYLNSKLTGSYNLENILAAACIGNYFSVDPLQIQKAIKNYRPTNSRSQLIKKGSLKIIMDAYNANPTSMQASIKSFFSNSTGEKFLILGDMLELGKFSEQEHLSLLKLIEKQDVSGIYLVGPVFTKIAANSNFNTFPNVDQLCKHLTKKKLVDGTVLIKGSRGIQLEKVLKVI